MASQWVSTNLEEEVTCPICLDILKDPVTIECGHNFCHFCITQLQEASRYHIKCPLCKSSMKRDTYAPNWLLTNLIQKIRAMDPSERQLKEKELRCPKHGEKLHYVCEADGEFLCVVCHDSKDHKLHESRLIEEAVEHHQEQIQLHVGILEQKEQELVHMKAQVDKKISHFMAQVNIEKQRIHTEFKHLQQVLDENKNFLLSNIEHQAQHGVKECEQYNADTQAQLSLLRDLMDTLKAKQQMPPRQLLQDIRGTLKRSEEFQVQFHSKTPIPLGLDQQLNEAKSRHDSVIESLRKCEEQLQADRKKHQGKILQDMNATHRQSAPVTFDVASAHPGLSLSWDLKTVTAAVISQNHSIFPVKQQSFYPSRCILGSPGFSTGRHTWEVELSGLKGDGAGVVGVAWEKVPRQGSLTLEPASGFWVLQIVSNLECQAITGKDSRENLPVCSSRVGVYVDFEGKEVTFYDATTKNHIYTFHTSFPGKIFPFFKLLFSGTQITLSP
ncbi:E3 ubiquitin-protein ligase TRIM31-like [Ochotona curzoniae]|uniref:E3 ubiquitin-protein ligase TRIM31-like n=1 Tax=Ochotona curzoniae TaxID=130825 RepID=UPI001B346445|nr:E3 ubiquitin-protein ligase TRIM31-like [Ochotona curzoniae]